ncbi:uncharacterized protein TNCV_2001821 [Trichonephila clavipes]|nr:uncharacterized protein TNCV_2001821 [Trichonephila clavipes]
MPRRRILAYCEQLSEFERDRIIGLKEGYWANRRIVRHAGPSDAAIIRCWQEWDSGRFVHHDGSGLPRATADQKDRLIVISIVTVPDSSFSTIRLIIDEFRFHLCFNDHRRRIWRWPGQRADPAFTIARHICPQRGVMVWGAISFEAGSLCSSLEAHLQHISIEVKVGITFQDGDRFNSCQVIYSQFGLAIHQNAHEARRRFVEWTQNEIAVVPDFHKRILFSDEAHFWLNGYVNKQNCHI